MIIASDTPAGRTIELKDGQSLHVVDVGEGRPIVFLHGAGPGASGWSNFRQNIPHYVALGYRCLAPDLLGFGGSSKALDIDYTFEVFGRALAEALGELGVTNCMLVGNSLGGSIAIRMALDYPELVSKVVLMAPAWLDERDAVISTPGVRAMTGAFSGPEGLTREKLRHVFELMFASSRHVTDEIVEERFAAAQAQNSTIYRQIRGENLAPRLSEIRQPVLALWGVEDRFNPVSGAYKIAEQCPDVRVVLKSDCGHWFMIEHREMFDRELLAFLRE
jgi:4,5:9,10-diseco-3-hydroxy-5,9,17-trioxoandrosta-1(10),2-diene-4-oate hydrolase